MVVSGSGSVMGNGGWCWNNITDCELLWISGRWTVVDSNIRFLLLEVDTSSRRLCLVITIF